MIEFAERKTELWVYPKTNRYQDKIDDVNKFCDFLNEDNTDNGNVKLYVHFPFCNSFCIFCPYYKEKYAGVSESDLDNYFDAVIKELRIYSKTNYFQNRPVQSIYFGGGDPCVVDLKYLDRILKEIYNNFNMSNCESITMEGNVSTLSNEEKQKWFKESGGTRVSFGIQTFKPELRKKLHLKPTEKEMFDLSDSLRRNGIDDFAFDMIYNFPDQTIDDVLVDAQKSVQLKPMCIDIHNCNVYPNTQFDKLIRKADYFNIKPTNKQEIEMYNAYSKALPQLGYNRIGAIFFSEKRKDVKYHGIEAVMRGCQILGIGPSSRSYLNRRSYRNVVSTKEYINGINNNTLPIEVGNFISERESKNRAMVFFPTMSWINKKDIPNDSIIHKKIEELTESGYIMWDNDVLRLKADKGFIFAGNVADYFTSDEQHEKYMKGFFDCLVNKSNPYNQDSMGIAKSKNSL